MIKINFTIMKTLLLICVLLGTFASFSQESIAVHNAKIADAKMYSFIPPVKLLNKEIWNRVADTRFECDFLRLAVEYQNNEFVLFEMDGNKLELSRASEYKTIGNEIAKNTFRVSPNYAGGAKTNSVVTSSF